MGRNHATRNEGDARLRWPPEGVRRVPFRIHSDPDIYDLEMEKIFRGRIWHYLGLEVEIPEPGDYRLTEVGETSVIMLRGPDGEVRALVNRCAHKGTMLLFEPFGRVTELMCVYHNWLYDLDGNLRNVPFAKGINGRGGLPENFDLCDHSLERIRVESVNGLVFCSFSDETEPLRDYLGRELMHNIDRVAGRRFKVLGYYSQYLDSNWKLYFENASDPYHATILHAWATRLKLNRFTMEGAIEMGRQGWHHLSWSRMLSDQGGEIYDTAEFRSGGEALTDFGLHDSSVIEQWDEHGDGITTAIQTAFPNFVLQQIHNTIATRVLIPRGVEGSELVWTVLGYEDDEDWQTDIRLKQGNLIGPAGYISMEDGMVGGLVQRGMRGDDGQAVMELDGESIATIVNSRASECGVRGFYTAYRELMDL